MKEVISELKQNPYDAMEFIVWGLLLYLFIYIGFVGFDNLEEGIYFFVESFIGE